MEVERLGRSWNLPLETACGRQIAEATADGYKRLLRPSITNEVRSEMRERAEAQAIAVFRANLEALLLQAPLGQIAVMRGTDQPRRATAIKCTPVCSSRPNRIWSRNGTRRA
jgi:transcriptional accessory protein Tex/SPT6